MISNKKSVPEVAVVRKVGARTVATFNRVLPILSGDFSFVMIIYKPSRNSTLVGSFSLFIEYLVTKSLV